MLKRQRKKRLKREIGRIRTSIDYSNGKDLNAAKLFYWLEKREKVKEELK